MLSFEKKKILGVDGKIDVTIDRTKIIYQIMA